MKTKTFIAIFMALLLVPLFVQAGITVSKHENQFSAYAVEPVFQICEGASRTDLIKVSNDGEFRDEYYVTIDIEEDVADWARLSKGSFQLQAQQKEDYLVFFDIPFDTKGEYPFTLIIDSQLGRDEYIQQILKVEKCQNIKLTVYAQEEVVLPCQPAFYTVVVENVADFGDNYKLDFGAYNEFLVTESDLDFYLAPGEIKEIEVMFVRDCGVCGEQTVPVSVTTLDNRLIASTPDTYDIMCKYSYSADLSQSHTICADIETVMPFNVDNHMYFNNSYKVDTNLPRFVTAFMDTESQANSFMLELGAESGKELALVANPTLDDVGVHKMSVRTNSVLGNIQKDYYSNLEVEPCYDFDLSSTLSGKELVDTICAGKYTYEFNVQNTGTRPQEYVVELHSPQWMKLDTTSIMLQPGENQNLNIYVDTPHDDAIGEAMLFVYNKNYPNIVRELEIDLTVISSHKCYMPVIDEPKVKMVYETDVVPLIITNIGQKETVYNIGYEQDFTDLSEQSIRLAAGESGTVHLVVKDNVYEFVEGGYPAVVTMTVTAPGDEYGDGLIYQLPLKIDLQHKSWLTRLYEKIVYDIDYESISLCQWTTVLLALVAILAFLFMLATRLGKMPGLAIFASGAVIVILCVIAILALIVVSLSMGIPDNNYEWEPRGSDYEGLYHEWGQNTNFVIDISKYFMDPDGDSLRYTSSQPTDVSVKIEGSYAILKPDNGFMGKNQIVFTAYDDRGGITDSEIIDLFVVPSEKLSFFGWWSLWCAQFNIWLLVLILIFVLLMRYKEDEEREEDDDDFNFSDLEDDEFDEVDEEYESIFEDAEKEEQTSLKKENGLFVYKSKKKTPVEVVDLPKEGVFVASKNGAKVHTTECMVIKRMSEDVREYFNNLEDAKAQGFKPCKVCLKDEA